MPRLPDMEALGARPVPDSRRAIASSPAAGAIGNAVEGLGQTVSQVGERQLATQDHLQFALADAAKLKAKTELVHSFQDDPDYGTFDSRYREGMASSIGAAAGLIHNNEMRAEFQAQAQSDVDQGASIVQEMARQKRISAGLAAGDAGAATFEQVALTAPDDATRIKALAGARGLFDGMQAAGVIDAATAEERKRQFGNKFATASVNDAVTKGDIPGAERRLGIFAPIMSPESQIAAREGIAVEGRRQEAIARNTQALADRQTRENAATIKAQVDNHVQVPDQVIADAQTALTRLGDTSGAFEMGVARVKQQIGRETDGYTPQQFDAEISSLAALGAKRTPSQDIRLAALQQIAPARVSQIRDDPYAWAALNGHAAQPVNFSDPASIQQRLQLQATVTAAAGVPVPVLTKNETADMRAQVDANPNARTQVLNTLGNIAAVDRNAAARAAHQVFPGDPIAPRIVLLNPHDRASAVRGQAARAKDRAIIDGPGTDGTKALALAKYQRDVQPALSNLNPEDADAVREMAGNMYADWATTHGVHDFNEGQYGTFLQRALGGQVGSDGLFRGGVGYWNNSPMVLPSNTTQRQFENLFTHLQWAKDYYPVYNRGEKMPPEALRQMVPVIQPNGRYEFHGPNGAVIHGSDGGTFTLDFEALAARRFR